mmetsp:Transcript_68524/g.221979  ORF Transcript_68524/g.221979 Transcript_68524/m.221979 type:complete len:229 (-) Transcript_68524:2-688(-)
MFIMIHVQAVRGVRGEKPQKVPLLVVHVYDGQLRATARVQLTANLFCTHRKQWPAAACELPRMLPSMKQDTQVRSINVSLGFELGTGERNQMSVVQVPAAQTKAPGICQVSEQPSHEVSDGRRCKPQGPLRTQVRRQRSGRRLNGLLREELGSRVGGVAAGGQLAQVPGQLLGNWCLMPRYSSNSDLTGCRAANPTNNASCDDNYSGIRRQNGEGGHCIGLHVNKEMA